MTLQSHIVKTICLLLVLSSSLALAAHSEPPAPELRACAPSKTRETSEKVENQVGPLCYGYIGDSCIDTCYLVKSDEACPTDKAGRTTVDLTALDTSGIRTLNSREKACGSWEVSCEPWRLVKMKAEHPILTGNAKTVITGLNLNNQRVGGAVMYCQFKPQFKPLFDFKNDKPD
jgi:hypothetical protein